MIFELAVSSSEWSYVRENDLDDIELNKEADGEFWYDLSRHLVFIHILIDLFCLKG